MKTTTLTMTPMDLMMIKLALDWWVDRAPDAYETRRRVYEQAEDPKNQGDNACVRAAWYDALTTAAARLDTAGQPEAAVRVLRLRREAGERFAQGGSAPSPRADGGDR